MPKVWIALVGEAEECVKFAVRCGFVRDAMVRDDDPRPRYIVVGSETRGYTFDAVMTVGHKFDRRLQVEAMASMR